MLNVSLKLVDENSMQNCISTLRSCLALASSSKKVLKIL